MAWGLVGSWGMCFGQPERPGQVGQVGQVIFGGVIATLINEYGLFGSKLANLAKLCRGRGGRLRRESRTGESGAEERWRAGGGI